MEDISFQIDQNQQWQDLKTVLSSKTAPKYLNLHSNSVKKQKNIIVDFLATKMIL